MYLKRPFLVALICSVSIAHTMTDCAIEYSSSLIQATAKTLNAERLDKYISIVESGNAGLSIPAEEAVKHLQKLRAIIVNQSGAESLSQEECSNIIASLALRIKEMVFLTLLDEFLNPSNKQALRDHVIQFSTFMKRSNGSYEEGYAAIVEAMLSIKDIDTVARAKEVKDKIMGTITTLPAHVQRLAGELIKKRSDQELLSALNSRIKLNKKK